MVTLLAVESSCDESAAALLSIKAGEITVLAEEISSQVKLHEAYGGIVPELAAREHLKNLPLITDSVLNQGKIQLKDLTALAVTCGPGLKGCLLMGTNFVKGLALAYNLPVLGINHIEGHIFSCMLDNKELQPPFLALVVSGGHTEIQLVKEIGSYELIARTKDDAAGEAFDKSANLLGFTYPGGAKLAALADSTAKSRFSLPKVMRDSDGFSFSGLKTAIALLISKNKGEISANPSLRGEIAYAVQEAIVDALQFKLSKAIASTGVKKVAVSGGVSANLSLRARLKALPGAAVFFPTMAHCVDNAAMIGYAAALRWQAGERGDGDLIARARWPLER